MTDFDLIIIGAGPGGYVAAIRAAQLGVKTALVEKMETLGGTCLNVGCIPSKALIHSSGKYHSLLHNFSSHGIEAEGVTLNLKKLIARKTSIVDKLTTGVAGLIKGNKIQRFNGLGILYPDKNLNKNMQNGDKDDHSNLCHEVAIYDNPQNRWEGSLGGLSQTDNRLDSQITREGKERERIRAPRIILATGSVPMQLPLIPFDGKHILSSTGALSLNKLPKTLAIIGAGAIGLEMAALWASLGTKVTVIEKMNQILPGWDSQLARTLNRELKQLGIEYILKAELTGAKIHKAGVTLQLKMGDVTAEKILVAVGRRANLQSAGIQEAGIALTDDGKHIAVDENYQTSLPAIYAIGDLAPGPMLAHKAEEEGIVAVERMNGIPAHLQYESVPSVVYTDPEAASVGVSEDELKKNKQEYKKGVFNIAGNGRGLSMGAESGFVKILSDPQTDRILGAQIVGPSASELISELVTMMEMRGSCEDIARIIHAHPTLSEAIKETALAVHGRSLHSLRK